MRIRWYTAEGKLLDTRWPKTIGEGLSIAKSLSRLIGFCCLELDNCKLRWFKKGKEL